MDREGEREPVTTTLSFSTVTKMQELQTPQKTGYTFGDHCKLFTQ
jgi:hypothetical protein